MCVYAVKILQVDLRGGKIVWFHASSSWLSERRSQGRGCHGSVFVFHPVKVLSLPRRDAVWSRGCSTSVCMRLCPLSLGPDLFYSSSLLCTAGSLVLHTHAPTLLFRSFCRPTFCRWKELRRLAATDTDRLWEPNVVQMEKEVWEILRNVVGRKEKDQRERKKRSLAGHFNTLRSIIRAWHETLYIISIYIPQAILKPTYIHTHTYLAWLPCYFLTCHAYFIKLFRQP